MRLMLVLLLGLFSAAAFADVPEIKLVIPANTKVRLMVVNEDATPEEFESHELNREKVVTGKATIAVYIGPLKPGRYPFFGDFHQDSAQGALIVR